VRAILVVDTDRGTVDAHLDRAVRWLATTAALQSAYHKRLHNTATLIEEVRIRSWLTELDDAARRHEEVVDELYRAFDRTARCRARYTGRPGPRSGSPVASLGRSRGSPLVRPGEHGAACA